jgi:hypothetical protein
MLIVNGILLEIIVMKKVLGIIMIMNLVQELVTLGKVEDGVNIQMDVGNKTHLQHVQQ